MEYRVMWFIDVDAESHIEAALQAQAIHRDPESIATIYSVIDKHGNGMRIDLDPALRH